VFVNSLNPTEPDREEAHVSDILEKLNMQLVNVTGWKPFHLTFYNPHTFSGPSRCPAPTLARAITEAPSTKKP